MSLHDQLRGMILACPASTYAIARAAGVAIPTISRYMNGTDSDSVLIKLANHYGLQLQGTINETPLVKGRRKQPNKKQSRKPTPVGQKTT